MLSLARRQRLRCFKGYSGVRKYIVLAIESSCDDSCATLLDRPPSGPPKIIKNIKKTLDSTAAGGIVPSDAWTHHHRSMADAVSEVLGPKENRITPDIVCATRGPGMTGSLATGLHIAKGLAVAWNKPFIGVHHMLGHLLVPRFESNGELPQFPFLSLLISGGHTMLILSKSLLEHEILLNTIDIAAGNAIDCCARAMGFHGIMLGKEMEKLIMDPNIIAANEEEAPATLPTPLLNNSRKPGKIQAFSFACFESAIEGTIEKYYGGSVEPYPDSIKKALAIKVQRNIFDHIIRKIRLSFKLNEDKLKNITDFVCSGGVASNSTLRKMLQDSLPQIENFHFPSVELCTDNSVMIGWAGIELYESENLQTELSVEPLRKWEISKIMEADGWIKGPRKGL